VRGPKTHDGSIITEKPDDIWVINSTGCVTDEGNATVVVVDVHCTGEYQGVRAALSGTRFEAMECLREAI